MATVGLVGIGSWGQHLLRNLRAVADVPICCHAGNAENARRVRDRYPDLGVTTDPGRLLKDDDIDAVAIATPIGSHESLVRRAVAAGKDVFVEKPLTTTAASAHELRRLAEDSDSLVFVGYIYVYHPLIRQLRSSHSDAEIDTLRLSWQQCGRFDTDVLLDLVSHPLSIARHLTGGGATDIELRSHTTVVQSPDIVSIEASLPGETACEITVNRASPDSSKTFVVRYEHGATLYWTEDVLYEFDRTASTYRVHSERTREPLRVECERFVDCVESGVQPSTDIRFGAGINQTLSTLQDTL